MITDLDTDGNIYGERTTLDESTKKVSNAKAAWNRAEKETVKLRKTEQTEKIKADPWHHGVRLSKSTSRRKMSWELDVEEAAEDQDDEDSDGQLPIFIDDEQSVGMSHKKVVV